MMPKLMNTSNVLLPPKILKLFRMKLNNLSTYNTPNARNIFPTTMMSSSMVKLWAGQKYEWCSTTMLGPDNTPEPDMGHSCIDHLWLSSSRPVS